MDVRRGAEVKRLGADRRIATVLGREFGDDALEFLGIRPIGVAVEDLRPVDQPHADAEVDARGNVLDLVREGGDVIDLIALHEHLGEVGAEGNGMVDGGLRDAGVEHGGLLKVVLVYMRSGSRYSNPAESSKHKPLRQVCHKAN